MWAGFVGDACGGAGGGYGVEHWVVWLGFLGKSDWRVGRDVTISGGVKQDERMQPELSEEARSKRQRLWTVTQWLSNKLLAGVLVSVPLIVTVLVLRVAYQTIDAVMAPFLRAFGLRLPGAGFVATMVLLLGTGVMATNVIGRRLIARFEAFLLRIPVIAPLYGAVKQALESFQQIKESRKFRGVAYLEYPSPGCRLIGFVTGNLNDPVVGRPMTTLFIPTSPNPLTGFVVAVPDELVMESGLTLEQASKLIVSAGLVTPQAGAAVGGGVGGAGGAESGEANGLGGGGGAEGKGHGVSKVGGAGSL